MNARYRIGYQAYPGVVEGDYGNTEDTWADSIERRIYGANGPESSEDITEGPNRVIITRVLLIPPGQTWHPRDKVTLPDEPGYTYEVEGVAAEGNRNPYAWNPGGTIVVRRVDA
ncbi:hypothetical protein ACLTEW_18455 [Gordonia lacunae]|uniref:hypothetical protein n=1 Tax=Gordonia lacunae TaxID=417102 RepID=UPI0039E320FF